MVIGGDFSADLDTQSETVTRPWVVGRWGGERTNRSSTDLLDFCDQDTHGSTQHEERDPS